MSKTQRATVLLVRNGEGNVVGMICGRDVYRLDAPLADEEIAEVLCNGGEALPIVNNKEV